MESSAIPIQIPLLNPNEPEAKVVSLQVEEGQLVEQGEVLCTLETTKSTAEVLAEVKGYVISLQFSEGQNAPAGARLCYLADSKDWEPIGSQATTPEQPDKSSAHANQEEIPAGLRISKPALKLARLHELDLNQLPIGPLVTESMVRENIDRRIQKDADEAEFDPTALIIYGGGGHGKSLIDLVRSLNTYEIRGIIDDGKMVNERIMDVPVLGGANILPDLYNRGIRKAVNAVGGIGDISSRIKVFQHLVNNGFEFPVMIHTSAVVEPTAELSPGVQIFPLGYIGSDVRVGFGAIINTGAVVSHDCTLQDYANISPGALLAGGVKIGKGSLIGMGVTINLGVTIGDNSRIGNGATIKGDVPENSIIKAGSTWPD